MSTFHLPTTILVLASLAAAQRVPVGDGSDRVLQLFDLRALRGASRPGPGLTLPVPGDTSIDDDAARAAADHAATASFVAQLIEPPLGSGDDCKVLGEHWLAVLATPAQIASAERLFRAAQARTNAAIDVQVQMFRVGKQAFADGVCTKLTERRHGDQVVHEAVVEKAFAEPLARAIAAAASDQLACPRIAVKPLQRATLSVMTQTAYVKDFTLTRVGESVIGDPVVGVVKDGTEVEVCATFLPDGLIALSCDVLVQKLQRPIATFETKLGDVPGALPITIQMPRVTGTRLRQTATLGEGSLVALAAQQLDGDYVVALISAKAPAK